MAIKKMVNVLLALLAFGYLAGIATADDEKPVKLVPVLKINKELDKRTVIKPSAIPGAGNGLFAAVPIKKGEVIGELGGQLVTLEDYPPANFYLASIPECAWEETKPYRFLDSKYFGGNVSRINFAPQTINGKETEFQNADIRQLCEYPYFIFVAQKDIAAGAEIWASYGPYYPYDKFMYEPAVRDYFCGLLHTDCSEEYSFEP
ncbi:MAG TPA: SET domain-containing protein-lysine N-methyltransferase [Candidatus Binatus sp.]|nr:SET domain-containing protein-lysine N-methyltransferase [Candidatus Binatus sp.]